MSQQFSKQVPAASSSSNKSTPVVTAPKSGTLVSVTYTPVATITGQNTNTRTLVLANTKDGYTPMATLPLTAGVVLTANVAATIPLTQAVDFQEGDPIQWDSVAVGNGIPDPGGTVTVTVQPQS